MPEQTRIVAAHETHEEAEEAVRELQRKGIDMHALSIVGRESHADGHVVGYFKTGLRGWRLWKAPSSSELYVPSVRDPTLKTRARSA